VLSKEQLLSEGVFELEFNSKIFFSLMLFN
jgi:hypothetical protein